MNNNELTQTRTADELHVPVRMVHQNYSSGGPMKEMMDQELSRHQDAAEQRLSDLERHYKR